MRKRSHCVRDPRAGILADWFGVEGGSAKVLLALYDAQEDLAPEMIADRTGVKLENAKVCISRLRKAGIEIPRAPARGGSLYRLAPQARTQAREAFAHAMRLLGKDVPTLDELESALAEIHDAQRGDATADKVALLRSAFGVYGCCAHILLRLLKSPGEYVSTHRLNVMLPARGRAFADPDPERIRVMIKYLRTALGAEAIETLYGYGYRLSPDGAQKVKRALAGEEINQGAEAVPEAQPA